MVSSHCNDPALTTGKKLPLMELFYSIQGEGFHTGEAACFIRIGGCDVGCKWCDVKESWNPELHPLTLTDEIIKQVKQFPSDAIVVTGGEPLLYNLDYLCSQLKKNNFRTFLETSGTHALTGQWDWICLSPKQKQHPLAETAIHANELKVIISNESDIVWAEEARKLISSNCLLYLQPEWSKRKNITPLITDYILKHPEWKVSIQTHKYLNIP